MLKTILENNYYSICEGFDDWREAMWFAAKPLLDQKVINPGYVDSIISNVMEHGPYIIIAPNICIPHAADKENVNKTAISFMKSNRPVFFGEDSDLSAQLFFVLASTDEQKHLENLQKLVQLLDDDIMVEKLLEITTIDELKSIS